MHEPMTKKFKLSELDAATYNPRAIKDDALKGLRESLDLYGMLEMPVVNVHGGKRIIVSGHQRITALIAEGFEAADCVVVDYDPLKEKMANLTMNNPAIQGLFDPVKAMPSLEKILAEIPRPDVAGFESLMNGVRAQAEKIGKNLAKTEANDDEAEKAEGAPKSKVGATYALGKHRLFCGRMEVGVAKLLGKKKAAALITDPPYRVAYMGPANNLNDGIENDDMKPEEWAEFLATFAKIALKVTDGPCYVFMSNQELPALQIAWTQAGGHIERWIQWVKDSHTLNPVTAAAVDYKPQSEPCLYGWRNGVTPIAPGVARTNVFEFPRYKKVVLHPTMKPVELIRELMQDATQPGDLVVDAFLGSGTTLVVAEELGRVCYGCEMDPKFCDVIRQRWAQQTHGEKANWTALTKAV